MATWYIDYSAARLSAATIKGTAVGPAGEHPTGVIRYIDAPENLQTKHTNKAEYDDLARSGLNMSAMYFEINTNDPLGGYNAGRANAQRAKRGADWLGFGGVILFCCDRWMNDPPKTTITAAAWRAYLDGAVSVLGRGRTGAYGFWDAMDAAVGHVDFFVQCGSRSVLRPFVNGWQDNNVQPKVGGIATDRVLILKPFSAPQEAPDMDDTQAAQLAKIHDYLVNPTLRTFATNADTGVRGDAMLPLADYIRYCDMNLAAIVRTLIPALTTEVATLQASVAELKATASTGGVDVAALAALIAPLLKDAVGPAVAEEFKNRLES